MARGGITPFPLDPPPPSTAPDTDSASTDKPVSPTSTARPPSFSLPQPVQRLLDFGTGNPDRDRDMVPTRSKSVATTRTAAEQAPLLTVKLSGPSFLDTVIRDTVTKDALYIVETSRDLTHVYRLDASRREAGKAASIQWPQTVSQSSKGKGRSGKSIQMSNGSWRDAEEFLKVGALGNLASRKFSLPHYPHTLKWKLIPGDCYVCGTSGIKGPVAVLDAATLSAPPRLRIYQTLTAPDHARSQQNHAGIPFLLLDYLVVTSLLLTTTIQEWLDRPADAHLPGSSSRAVKKWLSIIHPDRVDESQKEKEQEREQEKEQEKERDREDRESSSPGGTLGPGSSVDGSTPVTPSSGRGPRLWEAHMSWSSGSGSGGSETVISPSTPGTSLSSNSAYNLPPRYSSSHLSGVQSLNSSQTFAYGLDMSGSSQDSNAQSPPQRRFQVTNPEPTPDCEYESAPESYGQQHLAAPAEVVPPEASQRPSTASQSHPYVYDFDVRPSTASSLSSLNATVPTPTATNPTPMGSVRRPPRQLPRPPVLQDPYTYQQQQNAFALSQSQAHDRQRVASTPPSFNPGLPLQIPGPYANSPAQGTGSPFTPAHPSARSVARRSLGGRPVPPPPPPPSDSLPLPPKLAADTGGALAGQMRGMAIPPPPSLPQQAYYPQSYPQSVYGSPPDTSGHIDAGRVRASFTPASRDADTESVYEMPPPAYDAIDFSLRLPGQAQRRAQ
ncbi:uncharacterized protein B0H18DRAFT_977319 [Fomitopsis serialis]|uniref:uncharacterized protein n=1 Tax=Fomitopsis serialis TaxID=139415 RepID=UPI002008AA0D|nr:uncharacterized protein B0H18DRAFT_977319 [Neoantrodia serialis]KAH9935790.1 hypothetical protein B0H18DRAFT_977319 [Neoantrodia serialis]